MEEVENSIMDRVWNYCGLFEEIVCRSLYFCIGDSTFEQRLPTFKQMELRNSIEYIHYHPERVEEQVPVKSKSKKGNMSNK